MTIDWPADAAVALPTEIVKRDGRLVQFDDERISTALARCFSSLGERAAPQPNIQALTRRVINIVAARTSETGATPTVESVQDIVEMVLQAAGEFDAAKHYILYRHEQTRKRQERPIPPEVIEAYERDAAYFPTPMQRFQFMDKYSRWREEDGRRETWIETVDRLIEQYKRLVRDYAPNGDGISDQTYEFLRRMVQTMRAMPSMRLLSMAGPAFERDHATQYNCSYVPIDSPQAWVEGLLLSMAGVGVGFSVEERYVEQLPRVQRQRGGTPSHYTVQDSAEGWGAALKIGLEHWLNGNDATFDTSQIRPRGAPLKTKGGRASGPEPLERMLAFFRERILARQGKWLRPIDAHDLMCMVGWSAVSGGVRRNAMLSLFDADDNEMLHAKSGDFERENEQRWFANNSMVWDNVDDMDQRTFMRRFTAMIDSERGEPGIFNREAAAMMAPVRRRKDVAFGTNPCFHPDTIIETATGRKRIKDITEPTYVYSMAEDGSLCLRKASAAWKTRENVETMAITIANGSTLMVTPEHKIYIDGRGWVEAKDIRVRDRVVALYRLRRGAKYAGVRLSTQPQTAEQMEHVFIWEGIHGKKPDGYDVHHRDMNTYHNEISNFELLTHSEHARLTRLSVPNNHQVQGEGGRFISGPDSRRGAKTILAMPEEMKSGFHQYPTVIAITAGPTTDVYDISVEETHNLVANGMIAHNCGEIVLRPMEMCNLTAVVARSGDTYADLERKVIAATIMGTIQSLATHFPSLRPEWAENAREERLLGVDINGQRDCPLLTGPEGAEVMQKLRRVAIETNAEYAELLGINHSASITCVKPSGNSSQLLNASSGIHTRWAPYYIRNARVSASSPLSQVLRDSGVPMSPENGDDTVNPRTWVVSFPIKSPEGAITRNDVSAVEQCNFWLQNKLHWTEHNPSVTITYRPDEVIELMGWVWEHRNVLGGMAFLPSFDAKYAQLPYIEIDQKEYERRLAEFPEIDFAKTYRYEATDLTVASSLPACDGPVCELDA